LVGTKVSSISKLPIFPLVLLSLHRVIPALFPGVVESGARSVCGSKFTKERRSTLIFFILVPSKPVKELRSGAGAVISDGPEVMFIPITGITLSVLSTSAFVSSGSILV